MLLQFSVLDNAMHDTEKNGGQQLLSPEASGRAAAALRLECSLLLYLKVLCWGLIAKTAYSSCWSSLIQSLDTWNLDIIPTI